MPPILRVGRSLPPLCMTLMKMCDSTVGLTSGKVKLSPSHRGLRVPFLILLTKLLLPIVMLQNGLVPPKSLSLTWFIHRNTNHSPPP